MVKPAITIACIAIISFVIYLDYNNNYLKYSIEYKKVIFNKGDIEKHLEATVQLEDVSGMERVYRWVAAKRMIAENLWLGTGPNTFYPEYKKYTVNSFYTYVSDNPEQSTAHNYFLMIFCEQGIVGFLLFTSLYVWAIIKSSHLYLVLKNPTHKGLSLGCALALIVLLVHLTLNDLIETDEMGSLFFITIALIIKLDYWKKEEINQEIAQEI
jgi:O-antigen ligase